MKSIINILIYTRHQTRVLFIPKNSDNSEYDDTNDYVEVEDYVEEEVKIGFNLLEDNSTVCKIILVQTNCLQTLFNFCSTCGSSVAQKKIFTRAAEYHVHYTCVDGHNNKLCSWNTLNKCSLHISSVLCLNGINLAPFSAFAQTLNLVFIAKATYYRNIIAAVINDFWVRHKNESYTIAKLEDNVWISGDGQYDSPGFSAKYITYFVKA